ncbi:MAG: AI-2E family transporter [Thermoguttaceae bacterium]
MLQNNTPQEKETLSKNDFSSHKMFITRSLIVLASVVVILAGMKAAQGIVAPFCLAVFFAVVLIPPLRWLQSKGFSEISSFLIVSFSVVICGFLLSWMFVQSVNQFVQKTPEYRQKLDETFREVDVFLNKYGFNLFESALPPILRHNSSKVSDNQGLEQQGLDSQTLDKQGLHQPELDKPESSNKVVAQPVSTEKLDLPDSGEERALSNLVADRSPNADNHAQQTDDVSGVLLHIPQLSEPLSTVSILRYVQWFAAELGQILSFALIVLLMVVFMVLEASRMPKKLVLAFGTQGITNEHLQRISEKIWRYMIIKTIISAFVGLMTTIFLWIMGIEYAILWGLCGFFMNYIPNIGSIIASLPPIALAFFDYGFVSAVIVSTGLILINWIMGYYFEPKLLGDGLGISPLIVLLSLIFWGWLFGPIGMFLSAPLTIVVKIILDSFEETRWVSVLMDE